MIKLKIGKTTYKVIPVDTLEPTTSRGRIHYPPENRIEIAQRSGKRPRPRSGMGMHHTLWHELIHGVLFEMGSRKYRDENFVDELATHIASLQLQLMKHYECPKPKQ
jgi:hypothetical protein